MPDSSIAFSHIPLALGNPPCEPSCSRQAASTAILAAVLKIVGRPAGGWVCGAAECRWRWQGRGSSRSWRMTPEVRPAPAISSIFPADSIPNHSAASRRIRRRRGFSDAFGELRSGPGSAQRQGVWATDAVIDDSKCRDAASHALGTEFNQYAAVFARC